jgi:flagellar biosynthesis/type III secretory pathway protein FliH
MLKTLLWIVVVGAILLLTGMFCYNIGHDAAEALNYKAMRQLALSAQTANLRARKAVQILSDCNQKLNESLDMAMTEGVDIGQAEADLSLLEQGRRDGYTDGRKEGFSRGEDIGFEQGWHDGVLMAFEITERGEAGAVPAQGEQGEQADEPTTSPTTHP